MTRTTHTAHQGKVTTMTHTAQTYDGFDLVAARADRIGKLRILSDVKVWGKDSTSGSVVMTLAAHGTDQSLRFGMDTDGRLTIGD
jgi:YD repeat-containing protein